MGIIKAKIILPVSECQSYQLVGLIKAKIILPVSVKLFQAVNVNIQIMKFLLLEARAILLSSHIFERESDKY